MTDKQTHKCGACGQRVTIYSGGEGTNSYEPWCEEQIAALRAENERQKDRIRSLEEGLRKAVDFANQFEHWVDNDKTQEGIDGDLCLPCQAEQFLSNTEKLLGDQGNGGKA